MIDVLSVKEVRENEARVMQGGVSEDELIERAAEKLCSAVRRRAENGGKILVLYGGGNNGADGLSTALGLCRGGFDASVCAVADKKNGRVLSREKLCAESEIPFASIDDDFSRYGVIVDAMLGVGLDRELSGKYKTAAEKINASGAYVISADIPTGLDADGGIALGACVKANETVTFSCYKTGLLINDAKRYCGKITVADIGIDSVSDNRFLEEKDVVIKERDPSGNKYDYGKVAVMGGSPKMPGAALMAFESSAASLKSGAGLSVLCVPDRMAAAYQCRVKESMLDFMASDADGMIFDKSGLERVRKKTSCIAVGMGMVPNDNLRKIIGYLCGNFGGTLILDAGALGASVGCADIIKGAKCKVILTPHTGEFDRLCGGDKKDLPRRVKEFSAAYGCVTVCKGAVSIISDGKTSLFCDFGTPALSKGGSGDVLSGIIAALAVRYDPLTACAYSCYFLGKAAKRAEKELSPDSVIASDIIVRI